MGRGNRAGAPRARARELAPARRHTPACRTEAATRALVCRGAGPWLAGHKAWAARRWRVGSRLVGARGAPGAGSAGGGACGIRWRTEAVDGGSQGKPGGRGEMALGRGGTAAVGAKRLGGRCAGAGAKGGMDGRRVLGGRPGPRGQPPPPPPAGAPPSRPGAACVCDAACSKLAWIPGAEEVQAGSGVVVLRGSAQLRSHAGSGVRAARGAWPDGGPWDAVLRFTVQIFWVFEA